MTAENERCPNCGAAVHVHYGPDIRFNPPCDKPRMYRAECSGSCLNPSFTSFTRERALELWDANAIRLQNEKRRDRAASSPAPSGVPDLSAAVDGTRNEGAK
jgi:hypothetical protein